MSLTGLLTARQLVEELERLGVGSWTAAAVRQWTREEPPLPIASPGMQGGPHRYGLGETLNWLRARDLAERAKGFTRVDGSHLVDRIDTALRALAQPPAAAPVVLALPPPLLAPEGAVPAAAAGEARATQEPVSQAKQHFTAAEVDGKTEVDLLMGVLEGRDPRNWKAAEEALRIRNERLKEQRRWIPVDELQRALDAEAQSIASAINSERGPLKMALKDCATDADRDRTLDEAFDLILTRLSAAQDLADQANAGGAE